MTETGAALARRLCDRVAILTGLDPVGLRIAPVGSGGGWVRYQVDMEDLRLPLVVRLPEAPSAPAPDDDGDEECPGDSERHPAPRIQDEIHNLRAVAPLGLAPATLQFDPADGLWAYPLWPGVPVTDSSIRDPDVMARIARTLRLLHVSGLDFRGHSDPFAGVRTSQTWTRDNAFGLPLRSLAMLSDVVNDCRDVLNKAPTAPTPCINAPEADAYFDTGTRVIATDWSASSMGDPHYELADLSERTRLSGDQIIPLLDGYFGSGGGISRDRVLVYRLVAAYRRLMEQYRTVSTAVENDDAETDLELHRLNTRLDDGLMILENAAWSTAMKRLRRHVAAR
ncbi:hypothetical protein [Rhodospira trueperi]|uniref:Phosphotransferase enzyme family protein n=1 Tax=Rhodospira trueperi TaxID=69960 RepID=A0A1G7FJZ6_9PROT|nr:hypothetical protein [Rhodospira trueperi]SDE76214.1 hypothetical protein SAMN05421720_111105 [Rhodospira trueperi]